MKIVIILAILVVVCLADDCSQGFKAMFGRPSTTEKLWEVAQKWHLEYHRLHIFSEKCDFYEWVTDVSTAIRCRERLKVIIPEDGSSPFWEKFDPNEMLTPECALVFEEIKNQKFSIEKQLLEDENKRHGLKPPGYF